jgi:hypothetical protein
MVFRFRFLIRWRPRSDENWQPSRARLVIPWTSMIVIGILGATSSPTDNGFLMNSMYDLRIVQLL